MDFELFAKNRPNRNAGALNSLKQILESDTMRFTNTVSPSNGQPNFSGITSNDYSGKCLPQRKGMIKEHFKTNDGIMSAADNLEDSISKQAAQVTDTFQLVHHLKNCENEQIPIINLNPTFHEDYTAA